MKNFVVPLTEKGDVASSLRVFRIRYREFAHRIAIETPDIQFMEIIAYCDSIYIMLSPACEGVLCAATPLHKSSIRNTKYMLYI